MENIVLNTWIDVKSGIKVKIESRQDSKNHVFLILEIKEDNVTRKKILYVRDRRVFDESGKFVDFGDAYPETTEYGKLMITKKFVNVWLE